MKLRRSDIRRQAHVLPVLKFESQSLTSYAGLVLFQQLIFQGTNLLLRLRMLASIHPMDVVTGGVTCGLAAVMDDRLTATVFSFSAPESHRAVRTVRNRGFALQLHGSRARRME